MVSGRGIRRFDNCTGNVLHLGAVAALKLLIYLPVIVYPSHAIGKRELMASMAGATVACWAYGIMRIPMLEDTEQVMRSQISKHSGNSEGKRINCCAMWYNELQRSCLERRQGRIRSNAEIFFT